MIAVVQRVECVGGCGGSGLPSAPEVIGVAAGIASLAVAFYALKISLGSLKIAEEQHGVFLRNLNAHADFALRIDLPGTDGVVETTAPRLKLVWGIHVDNVGDKPARYVHVAFGVPFFMSDMQWEEGEKESLSSEKGGPYPVREPLTDASGVTHEAQVVTKRVSYIGRGGGIAKISAILELPDVGDEQRIPVKLLVSCDDLPEGVEDVVAEDEILVRRLRAAATAATS
jgi:hypothetical protein